MRLEQTILRNLIYNDEFLRKTLPFLKSEYFVGSADKVLFEEIQSFVDAYATAPEIEGSIKDVDRAIGILDSGKHNIGPLLSGVQGRGPIAQAIGTQFETEDQRNTMMVKIGRAHV